MYQGKAFSLDDVQTATRFAALRQTLSAEGFADHRQRPLAYWALPTDRRLPLAFLGRTLGELIDTSFEDLAATPGIGEKKIESFLTLLVRAAETDASELPEATIPAAPAAPNSNGHAKQSESAFDVESVSEMMWRQWQSTICAHKLDGEMLGRLAPTLRDMTRVIWTKPLREYVTGSLVDLRRAKTHGEKRVRAILEVFHAIHEAFKNAESSEHLAVRVLPKRIDRVEQWIDQTMQTWGVPTAEEIFDEFIRPLLEQIRVDASDQIVRLAENRLGVHGEISSVRQAAREMGLTRARVYQLLNEVNDIIAVRWPNGRHKVYELRDKFRREQDEAANGPVDLQVFHAAIELFYPGSRRGALDHVEQFPGADLGDEGTSELPR